MAPDTSSGLIKVFFQVLKEIDYDSKQFQMRCIRPKRWRWKQLCIVKSHSDVFSEEHPKPREARPKTRPMDAL